MLAHQLFSPLPDSPIIVLLTIRLCEPWGSVPAGKTAELIRILFCQQKPGFFCRLSPEPGQVFFRINQNTVHIKEYCFYSHLLLPYSFHLFYKQGFHRTLFLYVELKVPHLGLLIKLLRSCRLPFI